MMLPMRSCRILPIAALCLATLVPPACNIATPALYVLQGPGKNPAEFTLPKDRKTVVFVDDRRNILSRLQLRSMLADDIGQGIKSRELVTEIVSGRELIAFARRVETSTKRVSIEELGRAVGADVVIYVEMESFMLSPDGATPKPTATARVKVVDVEAKQRLFPPDGADPAGVPVSAEFEAMGNEAYRTSAARRALEDTLEKRLADRIVKLFYEYERVDFGAGVSRLEG